MKRLSRLTRFCPITYISLFVFVLISCSTKDDDSDSSSTQVSFTTNINADDPQLATGIYPDGTSVHYYGEKNANGIPTQLTQIEVVESANRKGVFHLDQQQRVTKMIAPDGTQFSFNWLSDSEATIIILTKDGSIQVNTSTSSSGRIQENSKQITTNVRPGKLTLKKNEVISSILQKKETQGQDVILSIGQCGNLTDPPLSPYLEIIDGNGNLLRTLYPKRTGEGLYTANVPINQTITANQAAYCSNLATIITGYCNKLDSAGFFLGGNASSILCPIISSSLDNLPANFTESQKQLIIDNCELLIDVYLPRTCKQLLENGSLEEQFCQGVPTDFQVPVGARIYGVVPVAPIDKVSASILIDVNNPIPNLSVDLGNNSSIKDFVISPVAPPANQSYTATISVSCVKAGSSTEISVEGSDGYSDTVTYNENSDIPEADYTLSVPGGSSGVQDVITVRITIPGQGPIDRTASLVFI